MAKINMTALNIELTPWNKTKSNKNLTAVDTRYLCEGFNTAIGYSVEETDIYIIRELLNLSKTTEGRKARCKVYDKETRHVIKKWVEMFAVLASHNGASDDLVKDLKVKMHKRTDYIVLKQNVEKVCPQIVPYLYSKMFVPTDIMPDEDDKLTETDTILFLEYIMEYPHLGISEISGLYWCFVQIRKGKITEEFMMELHEMSKDEKEHIYQDVKEQICFESKLDNNTLYVAAMQELVRIESGKGKLQDKKKVGSLIKSIAEIMDEEEDGIFKNIEYIKGISNIPTKAEEMVTIEEEFDESREVFDKAFGWYYALAKERLLDIADEDRETILEIEYRYRFERDMF